MIGTAPRACCTLTARPPRRKLDTGQVREGWRARWKRVLGVPGFESPLMKIPSPVVVVVRLGVLGTIHDSVFAAQVEATIRITWAAPVRNGLGIWEGMLIQPNHPC